ncbi:unnamed protein product [Closterium sp. Naga37s-1]|nr:unnamed protein product [Closterium sp. Naga37s-1]
MDGFRGAVDAVAAILRRVLLRDPSNRREACTWLAALIGRVQLPPALRRALVCQLVARSGSLAAGEAGGKAGGEGRGGRPGGKAGGEGQGGRPGGRPGGKAGGRPGGGRGEAGGRLTALSFRSFLPFSTLPHTLTLPPLPLLPHFPPSNTPNLIVSFPLASNRSLIPLVPPHLPPLPFISPHTPLPSHSPSLFPPLRNPSSPNPRRILLWFDHFSMGPSPSSQGSRRGEEGERSREQQRPSAYAATAYAAAAGSGSAQTKLAGSAAAGDALHRDSPGEEQRRAWGKKGGK